VKLILELTENIPLRLISDNNKIMCKHREEEEKKKQPIN
jgi:hypothetical protein